MTQSETADKLIAVVEAATVWLAKLDQGVVSQKPAADRWAINEVMGHLIDSACNNHQRFIRAQHVDSLAFPKYEQNEWVASNHYLDGSWSELIQFWRLYNLHLAHVIRRVPSEQLATECTITPFDSCTLEFLITDYVVHLEHHLEKIQERVDSLG